MIFELYILDQILLDEEDFIPYAYVFEVSSPGLGRPLKKENAGYFFAVKPWMKALMFQMQMLRS